MKHLAVIATGLFTLLSLAGCAADPSVTWHEAADYRWAELAVTGGAAGFEEVPASKAGVAFANMLREDQLLANRHYMNGSGVATGDVDGDGRPDLYLARLDGPNALYRNLGNWRFENVTDSAGVAAPGRFSTGAVLADLDGDGDLDLLVTALGGPNAAFMNDGAGRFREVTEAAGLAAQTGSTTMALSDVDGDGDLDLYVANYKTQSVNDLYPPDARRFDQTVIREGDAFRVAPEFEAHYVVRIEDERVLRLEYAEPDAFYLNDGTGRFRRVSFTGGAFLDEDGRPLAETPKDWALTARFQDVNGDGAPDLYVCNDFESPDDFWLGDGTGRFRAAPRLTLRKTSLSTMSVDFSDIDRDGLLDFFLTDMLSRDYTRRQTQVGLTLPQTTHVGEIDNRPQVVQNTLFLNLGDAGPGPPNQAPAFAEIANQAGLAASEWSWAATFLDVDLDGYEDLLVTTGHLYDVQNADAQQNEMQKTRQAQDYRRLLLDFPPLLLPNVAFRNRGDGTFEAVPEGWGLGAAPDVAHGLALADFDGDGDLDAVVNRLNGPAGLFRNTTAAPRLAVRLRGEPPNTQGVGAKIRVTGGPVAQLKEVTSGGLYLSGSEALQTFAAREGDSLAIEVTWRSGRRSRVEGARANRVYEIYEAGAGPGGAASAPDGGTGDLFFEDVSARLEHRHHESAYDDFVRQPLLPRRLSQDGPAVAWADLDDDGDDDLLLGSGGGGRLAVFHNEGAGRLRKIDGGALAENAVFDQAGIVAAPGADGGARVFVAVSNYEGTPRDSSWIDVYAVDAAGRARRVDRLPFGASSIGPLALSDLDGDGDLDLFAGGHAVPGRYPEAPAARLYRNEHGRYRYDAAWSRPFAGAGMVSAAAFGDLDGDGDADAALALEWGPLRYFRNDGAGRFTDHTEAVGWSGYTGWWRGVALGDFDGDGRLDVAATNAGWNTPHGRFEDPRHPLRLYAFDFDANGVLDALEAHYEADLGGYVPERGLSSLSYTLPYVRSRTPTYAAFAASTLREIVGPKLDRAPYLEAATLAHVVLLNRGERFEGRALPAEAQFAPAFAAAVADFDGDGREDLFLSHNFFALPMETPRLDGGRSLWLRGTGDGGFEAVPGRASGLRVYGEQRGAAAGDFDGDGRTDLVVTQNGAATKLYRNARAAPGVRVRLTGPPGNAGGVGAAVRLRYADGTLGPARLLSAGSGYWSQASLVQAMGRGAAVTGVVVRWPDGTESEAAVPEGATEVTVVYAGGGAP